MVEVLLGGILVAVWFCYEPNGRILSVSAKAVAGSAIRAALSLVVTVGFTGCAAPPAIPPPVEVSGADVPRQRAAAAEEAAQWRLSEQCEAAAAKWWKAYHVEPTDGSILKYSNHYNRRLRRCLAEQHIRQFSPDGRVLSSVDETMDVLEGISIGVAATFGDGPERVMGNDLSDGTRTQRPQTRAWFDRLMIE